jgi:hypothetical protein
VQDERVLWRSDEDLDEQGRYVAADLHPLIEQVMVSPTAAAWFECILV